MKRNIVLVFLLSALLVTLVSCATVSAPQQSTASNVPVGKYGLPMPAWAMGTPKGQDYVYGVGQAKFSNEQNSRKAASVSAKQNLAASLEVAIQGISTIYTNDAGQTDSTIISQAMQAFEELTIQKIDQVMIGVSEDEFWIAEDGTAFCLVSIPVVNVGKTLESVFEEYVDENPTFVKSEAADEANKMMNEAISKYFNGQN